MARELYSTLETMFSCGSRQRCYRGYQQSDTLSNSSTRYMEIPINTDTDHFEVPVFAFDTFNDALKKDLDDKIDAIIISLNTEDRDCGYRSLERCLKDILEEDYPGSRLVKIDVKDGNDTLVYYGTKGAIFDKDFNPIMVGSWQMERYIDAETERIKYRFLNGILRVNPSVYFNKGNSMERMVANKIINTCLISNIKTPSTSIRSRATVSSRIAVTDAPFRVEIADSPFVIHDAEAPGISTTNKQLLQVALEHIEEVMQ